MLLNEKYGKREIVFFTAVLLYILFVIIFIFFMRSFTRDYVMKDIDRRLFDTAMSVPYILPEDYHNRAVTQHSISLKEWRAVEKKLTEIASFTGMKYIWTDVLINGKVYLTTCNRTEQTEQQGLQMYYFMFYVDGVSAEEMSAFAGEKPVFTNFSDRWGNFRAVFIPKYSPSGRKYLACAEYTIDYVDSVVRRSSMLSMLIAAFFFFAFIPVFISYVWNSKQRARELKEKNIAIEKSEENLRITLNSIADGVIVVDQDGKIVLMNPVAELLTEWELHDAAGHDLFDIFCVNDQDTGICITDILERIIHEKHTGTYSSYLVLTSKNGKEIIVSENGAPIFNSEKKYIGSVIVFRDLTEHQRLEEQLRQSQKLESIGQLAGGVAHDFNNMLAAILGSAELLSTHMSNDPAMKQYADIIVKASEKASDLTHKLLAFSRKGKSKKEPFDMHLCIKNALTLLRRSIDRKIDIKTDLAAELQVVIGDNTLFENVILNIGINSRDAMPDGGIFSIATSNVEYNELFCSRSLFDIKPGKFLKIVLSDTGTGIPKNILEKVFEPFFTTKKTGKGTGLGLSVVYGTVKDHHGFLELDSEPGKGTTITINLPVSSGERDVVQEFEEVDHKGEGLILVADDEQLIRETLEIILTSMSYQVITAANGAECLERFAEKKDEIKTVFLDIIMPVMNGKETFIKLREMKPDLSVVLISGYTSGRIIKELIDLGVDGFIQKPYRKSDIAKMLIQIEQKIKKK